MNEILLITPSWICWPHSVHFVQHSTRKRKTNTRRRSRFSQTNSRRQVQATCRSTCPAASCIEMLVVGYRPTSSCMTADARLSSSLQAETRAEFAERSVAKLEKTIDDLEGMNLFHLIFRPRKSLVVSLLVKKNSTKTVAFRHQNGCLQTYFLLT